MSEERTISVPWKNRSRQETGMQTEKLIAKKRGARLHPRSGAGNIKDDASTDDAVLEIKDAMKSHTLQGAALDKLFRRATRQGKDAKYIVYFTETDLTATLTITKGKQ